METYTWELYDLPEEFFPRDDSSMESPVLSLVFSAKASLDSIA